ncbi:3-phosphoshikimate 1-carboxyvinyltransferase [Phycisphaerae bacterium RAS1]|nr:3-phosphoshikimate 1-carboxyvinyltransferase [Phycisphaerae bacterium RAS1]
MPIQRLGRDVRVLPTSAIDADVILPGSKSLANRFLVCAALACGESRLGGVTLSDDVRRVIDGLTALGVSVRVGAAVAPHTDCIDAGSHCDVLVNGVCGQFRVDEARIDAGAAGTAMRFLTAVACLARGDTRLDGTDRMRQRPIAALVDGLRQLGARIDYDLGEGFPPLTVHGRGLTGGQATFDAPPSSQFISALLMAAPYAAQDVFLDIRGLLTSRPYVDMTLAAMRSMGVETLDATGDEGGRRFSRFIVPASQHYQPGAHAIEPDASAAGYFWAAAAITGGRVRVRGLSSGSAQGDVKFVDVLEKMGCGVIRGADGIEVRGPAGGLRGVSVELNAMPDTVQTLAVLALFAGGPTTIRNVANLRIKETDRITALAVELIKLGARVETSEDGLTIHPPEQVPAAEIDTYDDHRMAMSFALAGLRSPGVLIREAGCVSKSFPKYFDALARLDLPDRR